MDPDYRARLSIEIREDQQAALRTLVPRGLLTALMGAILDDVIEMLRQQGNIAIAAIFKDYIPATALFEKRIKEMEDGFDRRPSEQVNQRDERTGNSCPHCGASTIQATGSRGEEG